MIYINRNLAFWIVSTIQGYWVVALCFSAEPLNTTPLSAMKLITGGSRWLVAALLAAGIAGGWWSLYGKRHRFWARIPQLFTMGATMWSDAQLVLAGHYADGVARSFWFLSSDQFPLIVVGIAYMLTTKRRAV